MTMEMVQKSVASWDGERVDQAKVVEENMLKQLWINPQEIPTNSFIQKYLTIVYRGILGAGNTLTIEKRPSQLKTPEVVVSHEGLQELWEERYQQLL